MNARLDRTVIDTWAWLEYQHTSKGEATATAYRKLIAAYGDETAVLRTERGLRYASFLPADGRCTFEQLNSSVIFDARKTTGHRQRATSNTQGRAHIKSRDARCIHLVQRRAWSVAGARKRGTIDAGLVSSCSQWRARSCWDERMVEGAILCRGCYAPEA